MQNKEFIYKSVQKIVREVSRETPDTRIKVGEHVTIYAFYEGSKCAKLSISWETLGACTQEQTVDFINHLQQAEFIVGFAKEDLKHMGFNFDES